MNTKYNKTDENNKSVKVACINLEKANIIDNG
jgi:hypothetical protein